MTHYLSLSSAWIQVSVSDRTEMDYARAQKGASKNEGWARPLSLEPPSFVREWEGSSISSIYKGNWWHRIQMKWYGFGFLFGRHSRKPNSDNFYACNFLDRCAALKNLNELSFSLERGWDECVTWGAITRLVGFLPQLLQFRIFFSLLEDVVCSPS